MNERIKAVIADKAEECESIIRIKELMNAWEMYCHNQEKWQNEVFVKDGPFPEYFNQKTKVLFIGRELYGDRNEDYSRVAEYWDSARRDMSSLRTFQSRLLYLAYGILHKEYRYEEWLKMPEAGELNKIFGEDSSKFEKTYSYAFMNASKILNTKTVNIGDTFGDFINDKTNLSFFIREIELLTPDIIVSGNLGDVGFIGSLMKSFRGKIKKTDIALSNPNLCVYMLNDTIPWIDSWHFSARKENFEGFYQPVCEIAAQLVNK